MGRAGDDDGRRRGDLGKDVRCAGDSGPAARPATPVVRAPGPADGGGKGALNELLSDSLDCAMSERPAATLTEQSVPNCRAGSQCPQPSERPGCRGNTQWRCKRTQ